MTDDRLLARLAGLDRPVEPPAAFADRLYESLAVDLGLRPGRGVAQSTLARLGIRTLRTGRAALRLAYVAAVLALLVALVIGMLAFGDRIRERVAPIAPTEAPTEAPVAPSRTPTGTAVAEPSPLFLLDPVTAGVQRLAVIAWGDATSEILALGVDGSGPARVVPSVHAEAFCQSADGSLIGFWATDGSGARSVHVARADGSDVRAVSDAFTSFLCRFPSDAMLLTDADGGGPLVRHDLATGAERQLAAKAHVLEVSPDGRRVALASDDARHTPLLVLDTTTGEVRSLGGDAGRVIRSATWSPDGTWIALVLQPNAWTQDGSGYDLFMVATDPGASAPRALTSGSGRTAISWSSDSRSIALRRITHDAMQAMPAGGLEVYDAATGTCVQCFGSDSIVFAGWSPADPTLLAYATLDGLYTIRQGETEHVVALAPKGFPCPSCSGGTLDRWLTGDWLGWSPDGRWIGLGSFSSIVAVVSVETGRLSILIGDAAGVTVDAAGWLR